MIVTEDRAPAPDAVRTDGLPPVGDRLRVAMLLRGMSWSRLAAASGLDQATIARVLARKNEPQRATIYALAIALAVDPSWLAGFRDGEPEAPPTAAEVADARAVTAASMAAELAALEQAVIRTRRVLGWRG